MGLLGDIELAGINKVCFILLVRQHSTVLTGYRFVLFKK